MTNQEIIAAGERLLRPYRIPDTCPYLSEDQRELSLLDLKQRSAWMAEWLMLAATKTPRLTRFRAPEGIRVEFTGPGRVTDSGEANPGQTLIPSCCPEPASASLREGGRTWANCLETAPDGVNLMRDAGNKIGLRSVYHHGSSSAVRGRRRTGTGSFGGPIG